MNYCTVPQNQDPSINISLLAISLVVTVLAYCAFPLIYARNRKNAIQRKKYTFICYGINFLVMLLFAVINGSSSGAPYFLWTWVFSKSGLKTLERRGLLEEVHNNRTVADSCQMATTETTAYSFSSNQKICFCRKCGASLKGSNHFCSNCGTEVTVVTEGG